VSRPEIVPYSERWPDDFRVVAVRIRSALGKAAVRIDHIGSTAVPGLPAKDTIDVQVSVTEFSAADGLVAAGFREVAGVVRDHRPPGAADVDEDWLKRLFGEPEGERRANVHVRVDGQANARYALLFRDYLRARPRTAEAYAELKRRLAAHLPNTMMYADVKDPAVDLIALAAEEWSSATEWRVPLSDG